MREARPEQNRCHFNLTYLDRHRIRDRKLGLKEPSGLVLSPGGEDLWLISDDTGRVFRIDPAGRLKPKDCFDVPVEGLEGIALDPGGDRLVLVREEGCELIELSLADRRITRRRRLADLEGYGSVAAHFHRTPANKQLEGITWNVRSGTFLVIKEGLPGLLLEISTDLTAILGHRLLGEANGFRDPALPSRAIDFSGLCHDPVRDRIWIASDRARRIFLYDWHADTVVHSARLAYGHKGRYREVEKAEGLAIDAARHRLYVVSDSEARLYVFDVQP